MYKLLTDVHSNNQLQRHMPKFRCRSLNWCFSPQLF